jgi:hypothetical protein
MYKRALVFFIYKSILISILCIKNTGGMASIVVLFEAIQNTCSRFLSYT